MLPISTKATLARRTCRRRPPRKRLQGAAAARQRHAAAGEPHDCPGCVCSRRVDGRPLPPVSVLDMRGQPHGLHPHTAQALADVRARGARRSCCSTAAAGRTSSPAAPVGGLELPAVRRRARIASREGCCLSPLRSPRAGPERCTWARDGRSSWRRHRAPAARPRRDARRWRFPRVSLDADTRCERSSRGNASGADDAPE